MGGRLVKQSCCPIEALDDELLMEIIIRGGVDDDDIRFMFRCKCVCKRWLRLINPNPLSPKSDPYLIRRYLIRRPDPPPLSCLLHRFDGRPLHVTTVKNKHKHGFNFNFSLSFLPCPDPSQVHILSSVNDLILCCPGKSDHSAYFICNSLTKQWISLPPPPLCSQRPSCSERFPHEHRGRFLAGFAFDEDHERFRVICLPSRNEFGEIPVEVFSSETGQWATHVVARTLGFSMTSGFPRVAVCNGIAYWLERRTFTAFNLWDNSYRFIPAPRSRKTSWVTFFAHSQGGLLRALLFEPWRQDVGENFEVYVLKDNDQWCLEHDIYLRQLTCTPSPSNWLSQYPWRKDQGTVFMAFHPHNGDIIYMICLYRIVECNMQSGEWRQVDKIERGGSTWIRSTDPLVLPWWPTPLPRMKASGTPLVHRVPGDT